jgi:hypothetical protein
MTDRPSTYTQTQISNEKKNHGIAKQKGVQRDALRASSPQAVTQSAPPSSAAAGLGVSSSSYNCSISPLPTPPPSPPAIPPLPRDYAEFELSLQTLMRQTALLSRPSPST